MTNAEVAKQLVQTRATPRGWEIRLPGVVGLARLKTRTVPKTAREAEALAEYFRGHVAAILDRADRVRKERRRD